MRPTILKSIHLSLLFHAAVGLLVILTISNNLKTDKSMQPAQMVINLENFNFGSSGKKSLTNNIAKKPLTHTDLTKNTRPQIDTTHSEIESAVEGSFANNEAVINDTSGVVGGSGSGTGDGGGDFNENIQNYFEPHYPRSALKRGLQGTLKIKIFIGKDGIPLKTQILQSSGHNILDNSAIEAAKKWVFKKNNISEFYIVKTIIFQLKV